LSELNSEKAILKSRWEVEKREINKIKELKEEIEKVNIEIANAERNYDLNKLAELKYGKLAELEKKLKEEEKKAEEESSKDGDKMLQECVNAEEISNIISKWTGIPVSKLMEGEKEKILHLDKEIAKRVVGQEEAIKFIADTIIRSSAGLKDPGRPIGSFIFLGPTGVGKTTTAAKIVANRWREEHDVGFITADTYRLEAVSQLKAYANIMRVPVEVIKKPEELAYAVEKFKKKDFVIIDTAGRSPKNKEQMEELKKYLQHIGIDIEVCLVLSATTKLSVMYETIEKFGYIGFSSIIFTKIDETSTTGSILSVCDKYNLPVSYITTGQKVPGDVEVATKERVTEIFFKELI
jgi:flagellar biosynthesis GTPase FlhF